MLCFRHVVGYLNQLLKQMAKSTGSQSVDQLTKDIHVWPDFHGNRSPLADPTLRGMVSYHFLTVHVRTCLSNFTILACFINFNYGIRIGDFVIF